MRTKDIIKNMNHFKNDRPLTVCYFGMYRRDYRRTRSIILGLLENGVRVLEVCDRTPGWKKFLGLYKKHRRVRNQYDILIVGFPGQIIVPFAKLISRKPLIYDALVSLYDSNVFVRKQCSRWSLKAFWYFFLDWLSCHLADGVLLDTKKHVEYFVKTFHVREEKFIVVYHGCENLFYDHSGKRSKYSPSPFLIAFHGYITPLHGISYVLLAMKELENENMALWIIGDGKDYRKMIDFSLKLQLKNVRFFSPMPPHELVAFLAPCDLGLGIFGHPEKVDRVIPNKVYELMAMKIPVLTADTPAIREKFVRNKHIFLCRKADPHAIAQSLREISQHPEMRKEIAENAYEFMKHHLVPKAVGRQLLDRLQKFFSL